MTRFSLRRRALLAPAAIAALVTGAAAAPLDAQPAQGAAPAQAAPRIPHEKYTLPNGLEVILHVDRSVPIVAVETFFKVGSGDEQPGRTGFAHLFEHIMFMGSQNVPVGKFDEWLEGAGASNNGSTTEDRTNYYETGPSNALPLMLWLDADRMGWLLPTMDQAKLDLQRDVVKNERRQGVDNAPYGRADETLLPLLYPKGHPYSWSVIGSMDDLSAASVEDVKGFFRRYYAPNNATLTIAGDFNPDSAKAWVQRYFGNIPRNPQAPVRPLVPRVALARDTFAVLEDRVQLPRTYSAWHSVRAFHPDAAALEALAKIVAGGRSSRLYQALVLDAPLAVDVGMRQEGNKLDGQLLLTATARPGVHPRAIDSVVTRVIADVAARGVTVRELERVKNGERASAIDGLSSVLGKAMRLSAYNYFAGTPDFLAQDLARTEALTPADVQRAAAQYLAGKPRVVLTVVPEGKTDLALTAGGSR
jgi:zinc protease